MKRLLIFTLVIVCIFLLYERRTIDNEMMNNEESKQGVSSDFYEKGDSCLYEIVYITKTGKCYHKEFCPYAKNVYLYMYEHKALDEGYYACYYCCP